MSHPPIPAAEPTSGQSSSTSVVTWPDPARKQRFDAWLGAIAAEHSLDPSTVRIASADASFRRYLRVDSPKSPTGSLIVMDAPPDKEDCKPFVHVAGLMADARINAPVVHAWNEPDGFMLLSDLGHRTMMDGLDKENGPPNLERFLEAVDILVEWQLSSKEGALPPYDEALLRRELSLFPDWYVAKHRGITLDEKSQSQMNAAFELIIKRNLSVAKVFVHRDFMPRNLMLPVSSLPHAARAAHPGMGVLDFQDAVYGPITYDIASLMRDAFISWEEDFVLDVTVRYWQKARKAGLPVDEDFGAFYREVEWMGLQRHLKVAGIFARLTLRDGKPKYLADTPRFIQYIRRTTDRYRELGPFLKVIDAIEGTTAAVGFAYGRM